MKNEPEESDWEKLFEDSDPADSKKMSVKNILQILSHFTGWPLINATANVPDQLPSLLRQSKDDFFCADTFEPKFVAETMLSGFLPTGMEIYGQKIFTPKLHQIRSVLDLENIIIQKSIFRHAKTLTFSVDHDFLMTMNGCVLRHGRDWLLNELTDTFQSLFNQPVNNVRMHSFEIWQNDLLAAGEIGYSYGLIYTSLTGFFSLSGAGSVQLACTGAWLKQYGYKIWDFGMPLPYKGQWGALNEPRNNFLKIVHQNSIKTLLLPSLSKEKKILCKDLLRNNFI